MNNIIDGKAISASICESVKKEVEIRKTKGLRLPGLAVIMVGSDQASKIYVRNKRRACEKVGFISFDYDFDSSVTNRDLASVIQKLNNNDLVDGILVQLPLPEHINSKHILEMINPHKDVDGFHPYNLGRLVQRRPLMRPCTPKGIVTLLKSTGDSPKGKHAVIIGASNIVGRPMSMELLLEGSTVTICHKFTDDLISHLKLADIIIVAIGKPKFVQGEWLREGTTVIDVGINRLPDGTLSGDVDFDSASRRAKFITPVPGGVGPMTIASLLQNTLFAHKHLNCIKQ